MVLRFVFTLLLLSSLAGCSAGLQMETGQSLFRALPGSEFILHSDVVITPGQIRASFQGGQRVNGAGEFEPRCELEVRDFAEEPQTIPAGTYRIVAVHGLDRYVNRPPGSNQLAAAGVLQLAVDTSSEWYMRTYHMTLQAEMQAPVPVLVCGGAYNYAFYVRYPSLHEMQLALGDYAELRLR